MKGYTRQNFMGASNVEKTWEPSDYDLEWINKKRVADGRGPSRKRAIPTKGA